MTVARSAFHSLPLFHDFHHVTHYRLHVAGYPTRRTHTTFTALHTRCPCGYRYSPLPITYIPHTPTPPVLHGLPSTHARFVADLPLDSHFLFVRIPHVLVVRLRSSSPRSFVCTRYVHYVYDLPFCTFVDTCFICYGPRYDTAFHHSTSTADYTYNSHSDTAVVTFCCPTILPLRYTRLPTLPFVPRFPQFIHITLFIR